jgi:D-cysteine desulfhydrase
MLGLRVHLILRDEGESQDLDANLLLDALAGAVIERVPKAKYVTSLQALLEQRQAEYAAAGSKARVIPTGASDGVGIWGYVRCAQELAQDCHRLGFEPELVVCATGSGGTQAGLTLGAKMFLPGTTVVGYAVCDSAEYFQRKVAADVNECLAQFPHLLGGARGELDDFGHLRIETVDQYIGPGYAKPYPELLAFIAAVAKSTGIMLDPVYTGKALYGLVEDIKAGRFAHCERICFVHTGGIFGLFPYREALAAYC